MVNGGDLFSSLLGLDYLDRFRRYSVEGDTLTLTR
jgi:predicted aspartyl protease